MTDNSFDDVAGLTDWLYDAVYDDEQWVGILDEIKTRLNGSHGAFGFMDTRTGAQHMLQAECTPEYAAAIFAPELANPMTPRLFAAVEGDAFTDEAVLPKEEFYKGTFYNEWFRPQDEHSSLNVIVLRRGDSSAHFTMMRGGTQPAFEAHDVDFIRRLLPTFTRVSRLRTRVGALQLAEQANACEALRIGFMVVDGNGRLLLSNSAGERFLTEPRYGLAAARGYVRARSVPERNTLRRAIAEACTEVNGVLGQGGDMLLLDSATGLPAAALSVAPMPDAGVLGLSVGRAAALFIHDLASRLPPRFEARMQALFGLTPKEAALAAALASGETLKQAAEERFIAMPTARTHLAQIFRKTHTSQQSQLVSLLLGILPPGR